MNHARRKWNVTCLKKIILFKDLKKKNRAENSAYIISVKVKS